MAGGRGPRNKKPRPSLVTLDLDQLRDLLSPSQAPSAAVKEAPAPSARFILTRGAKRDLATSPAAPSLPPDASLVSPPKSSSVPASPKPPPHRPAAQLRVFAETGSPASNSFSALADAPDTVLGTESETRPPKDVTAAPRADQAGSGTRKKRGGAVAESSTQGLSPPPGGRQVTSTAPPVTSHSPSQQTPETNQPPCKAKEKAAAFLNIQARSTAAESLDDMAGIFKDLVALMRDYKSSSPTAACFQALDSIQSRLENHHEFRREAETADTFSAILTKSVSAPMLALSSQLQSQHKAIQALSKVVESVKLSGAQSNTDCVSSPPPSPPVKTKPVPLPSPSEERILVRCDGDAPPIFQLPYHQLIPQVNSVLSQMSLPLIKYASRLNASGIFLVPESKEAVAILEKNWAQWGHVAFPGSRIAPPAVHCHIQVDGISQTPKGYGGPARRPNW
ncbi:hypothetical protein B0H13DRAFT_2309713 [Mycena leptocephala]|nr:hypothetical protein B0H13DRAFT_2309713 [Mycena leptocephala]